MSKAAPRDGVRLGDHPVQQGEQDGVLRGEVEVEGRPGDARAAGQVVDRDRRERLDRQQPLGRGEDRELAVVTGRPHRASAAGSAGGLARGYRHASQNTGVDPFLNTALTRSTARRYRRCCTLPRQCRPPAGPPARTFLEFGHGARSHRPRGRPDRRRGAVRHRRRLPSAGGVPGQELRDPGVPGRDRGHLGSLPVSRGPLGLRHVHPRLRLPAVEGLEGHRGRSGDPPLHRGHRRRVRRPGQDPLPPPGALRRVVDRRRPLDGHRPAQRHGGGGRDHLLLAVDLRGLLPVRRGLPAALRGGGAVRRAGGPSAALAGGPRRHRTADRRHRQRRHRRHARAQPRRGRRARHDAAAHPELRPVAARPGPAGPGAGQPAAREAGLSDRAVEERPALHGLLPVQPALARGRPSADPPAHREAGARTSTSTRTSTRPTTPGTSGCAWSRTATSSASCDEGRRRS